MDTKIKKIRELNDNLRQNFSGGRVMLTRGVADLPLATRLKIMQKVQSFNNFNASNDPYGEHDFGAFDFNGVTYFWKIDYYDLNYEYLSIDPNDTTITNRVLTIMLAYEY